MPDTTPTGTSTARFGAGRTSAVFEKSATGSTSHIGVVSHDGVQLQWMVLPPEDPPAALGLPVFQGPQNLSAHNQGQLGYSLSSTISQLARNASHNNELTGAMAGMARVGKSAARKPLCIAQHTGIVGCHSLVQKIITQPGPVAEAESKPKLL